MPTFSKKFHLIFSTFSAFKLANALTNIKVTNGAYKSNVAKNTKAISIELINFGIYSIYKDISGIDNNVGATKNLSRYLVRFLAKLRTGPPKITKIVIKIIYKLFN